MPSWLKKERVQERKVLLTHEAINDIADAEVYINGQFGEARAGRYRADIKKVLRNLSVEGTIYSESGFYYRNYIIYKKPFTPAIIFWITSIKDDKERRDESYIVHSQKIAKVIIEKCVEQVN